MGAARWQDGHEEPEALVGTPVSPPRDEEETVRQGVTQRHLTPEVVRRQIALDMAIDAKARQAHVGTQTVVELAREYDEFLKGQTS